MKKYLLLILSFAALFISANSAMAASSISDYTYVDCHAWNDNTAVPFDSSMPYNTLRAGIEKSISYINTNWNIPSNANNVVNKRYVIQVKSWCVFDWYNQNWIWLYFTSWTQYKNDIIITSDDDNQTFGIKNFYFDDANLWVNHIIFSNTDFIEWYSDWWRWCGSYFNLNSQWITITNSIINIKKNNSYYCHAGQRKSFNYRPWSPQRVWNIIIDNSNIKIHWDSGEVYFSVPWIIKNSKIDFIIPSWNTARLQVHPHNSSVYLLSSNVFNLWWQDLYLAVDTINNKFESVKNFSIDSSWRIFLNNTMQNSVSVNAGSWFYTNNNLFQGWYSDSTDPSNLRKNFSSTSTITGWYGWIYRRALWTYMEVNMSDKSLYHDVTWNDLWDTNSPIYLIFQ